MFQPKRQFTLMPHQEETVEWLMKRKGIGLVYGDPGIGKTFIATEFALRSGCRNVLILCPATLKRQWKDEVKKYCGESPIVVDGSQSDRVHGWKSGYRFKVSNYEKVFSDIESINSVDWDLVIFDESHLVNTPAARRTKACKKIRSRMRVALSGDPFPNALWECYSIIDWLSPGYLGQSWPAFRSTWCYVNPEVHGQVLGVTDPKRLKQLIAPFIRRIHKEDVITDLAPKKEVFEWVELDQTERKMYVQLQEELKLTWEGEEKVTVTMLLAMMMRQRQCVDDPMALGIDYDGSKVRKLHEILTDGYDGKTIVFTEFSTLAHRLARKYGGSLISGKLTTTEREIQIQRFKNDPQRTLLFSTAAGGYGLNLTVASRVVHFGVPWNWSRVNQRVSRAWRKGQERTVIEIYLLAKDSVDVKMQKLVEKKRELAAEFDKKKLLEMMIDL